MFRFDAGSWWRYDDTTVTKTWQRDVLNGANRRNGYIFLYMHSALWKAGQAAAM